MTTKTTVIYNADCPICSREIAAYERYCHARALAVEFAPLQSADLRRLDLDARDAARRLHVVRDGELLRGVPAFLALWESMPRFRPLSRLLALPGLRHVTALVYEAVLAPALFALHRRRQRRRAD